jgi:SPP1 gp7 family putative phage head morphogenesis protein
MARTLDDTARFLIQIIRRGGALAKEFEVVLLDGRDTIIQNAIKREKAGALQAQIVSGVHQDVNDLNKELRSTLVAGGIESGEAEATTTARFLAGLGVADPRTLEITERYVNRAFRTPFPEQKITVENLLRGMSVAMDQSIVNVTRDAFIRGTPIRSVAGYIRNSNGQLEDAKLRRDSQAVARTAVQQVSNAVRADSFNAEPEVTGVIYVATLDHRTSNICKVLDGRVWNDKRKARVPPLHVNCRSSLAPILKGENANDVKDELSRPAVEPRSVAELEEQGLTTRTGRVRRPSSTGRSPLQGVVKSNYVTYEQWLKTQPVAYQREILGPKALREFRRTGDLGKAVGIAE